MFLTGEIEMTQKKKYSKEFKLDAVNLVIQQNYTRAGQDHEIYFIGKV